MPAKKSAAKKKPAKKAAAKKAAKKVVKKKAPAKKTKRKANPALLKPLNPSPALAEVVGPKPAARGQIVKKLWEYIKKKGLQDKTNKRQINADDKLKTVFGGKASVNMFEMTKLVSKHIS